MTSEKQQALFWKYGTQGLVITLVNKTTLICNLVF